jgi:4-hydroxy-tetrahydrodipicolinate synthase
MKIKLSRDEIRYNLSGPVATVRTPFMKNGEVDYNGLRRYIDFIIENGSKTVILTHGDSLYSILTSREIAEITSVVVSHVGSRAMVCAATGIWSTPETIEFAQYCNDTGVDILMVLPPDWSMSLSVDTIVQYYRAAADIIPVMMVTNIFIPRGVKWGLKVVSAVRDRVPNVAAVKDDFCNGFGRRLSMLVYDSWAVLSGGQKQNHLNAYHYGCDGYISTFLTFKPEIAHQYWDAIKHEDFKAAVGIIHKFDNPFFDYIRSLEGGFDAGLHGVYELFGIYKRWRRLPYHSLTDSQMVELEHVCRTIGIL